MASQLWKLEAVGQAPVESLAVSAFTVPTDAPESDGTAEWDSTTIVVVEATAGGETGLGYTYAPAAAGNPTNSPVQRTAWFSISVAARASTARLMS